MRLFALLISLALALPVLAGEPSRAWPQKGDTVYVAAVLPAVTTSASGGSKLADLPELPACSPLDVGFRTGRIGCADAHGAARIFDGDWKAIMFASREECLRAPLAQAKVLWRYGGEMPVYTIAPPRGEQK